MCYSFHHELKTLSYVQNPSMDQDMVWWRMAPKGIVFQSLDGIGTQLALLGG